MNTTAIRAGSYYTTINSDCVEFCPHPNRQSIFFTAHYELLSSTQGKIGQFSISEVNFSDSVLPPTAILEDQYCIETNENQEAYATRSVDMIKLLSPASPTFGQATPGQLVTPTQPTEAFPLQPYTLTNLSLNVHDQLTTPAILDAKWSYQPIPIYTASSSAQSTPKSYASLIAGAFEDGSIRVYSYNSTSKQIEPHCAVQLSTSAICLYIDWSNSQRYSPIKASYPELFPTNNTSFKGEDEMAAFFDNEENYNKFWAHYDHQIFSQCKSQQSHQCPTYPELNITPHYCEDSTNGKQDGIGNVNGAQASQEDVNVSNIGDYGDQVNDAACNDEFYEYDVDPMYFFQTGKRFVDNFVTCSLSDGTVAVCDIKPIYSSNATDDDNTNTDDVKFNINLTHHWQAHQAECWVSACDGFNPNLIYTGADDNLMKMWDLRLINTVNARMEELELNPIPSAPSQKGYIYNNLEKITCPRCSTSGLSYLQSQSSQYHGGGFEISNCTSNRGLSTQCSASTDAADDGSEKCYCSSNTSSIPTTQQYRFDIDKLIKDNKFNMDFAPVQDSYPTLINNQHQAGVVEIKPHPYNPFLLLTGSYDNHISLYDKRNLRKPVTRVDTTGGVWRIKWHPNPIYSNQFFIVNMYNGVSMGSINGMNINISEPPSQPFGVPSFSDVDTITHKKWSEVQQSTYGNTNLFQNICSTKNKSNFPSWSYTTPFQTTSAAYLSPFLQTQSSDNTIVDPTTHTKLANTQMGYLMDHCYNFGSDGEDITSLSIDLQQKPYDQHGSKTIVYGGDWCSLNNISDLATKATQIEDITTTQPLNNIAVTCSFYNKRTDLLSFESIE